MERAWKHTLTFFVFKRNQICKLHKHLWLEQFEGAMFILTVKDYLKGHELSIFLQNAIRT